MSRFNLVVQPTTNYQWVKGDCYNVVILQGWLATASLLTVIAIDFLSIIRANMHVFSLP